MTGVKSVLLCCVLILSLVISGVECSRAVFEEVENFESADGVEEIEDREQLSENQKSQENSQKQESWIENQGDENENKGSHVPSSLGPKITDWDEQRERWLEENPHMRLTRKGTPRIILVSSSQSEPCPSATGDHQLLKSLKNKIDYARLHDIEIYYNMVLMEKTWTDFWIKMPVIRKLMVTHPEVEWIWWMDSDAIFTDMTFEVPLEKYKDHNLVVHGWDGQVYERKNWVGLNAGIYLMRNCQWSLDLMDVWAAMGEDFGTNRQDMGNFLSENLIDRPPFVSDDQSALVYMLSVSRTEELKPKVYLENSYALHGYWVWVMGQFDTMLNKSMPGAGGDDWPFITHFVGCKPCSGTYTSYDVEECMSAMERAFNLADNQILEMYGYEHEDLSSERVTRVREDSNRPLDYLGKSPLDYIRQHPWIAKFRREKTTWDETLER